MKEISLIDYYHRLIDDDMTLAYFGIFKDSIVEKVVDLSESFLENNQLGVIKRRAVFLVAECFQNVARHGTAKNFNTGDTKIENAFFMRVKDKLLHIASANPIKNDKIELLTKRINYLNQLNTDELSKLHKSVLEEGTFSDKGGASLGLIEMARKTGNKLNFHFEPYKDDHSIFYIMLSFGPPEIVITNEIKKKVFDEIIQIDDELFNLNQYLLYKSDFTHDTLLPIIQMIENNLSESNYPYAAKRNLFHASVEMMQNINHHALQKNGKKIGVFTFGLDSEGYSVKSVSELDQASHDKLKSLLKLLKTKSEPELKSLYKESLRSKKVPECDLTFIDLARISKSWKYKFFPSGCDSFLFDYKVYL